VVVLKLANDLPASTLMCKRREREREYWLVIVVLQTLLLPSSGSGPASLGKLGR